MSSVQSGTPQRWNDTKDLSLKLLLTSLAHEVPEVCGLLEAEIIAEHSAETELLTADIESLGRFLRMAS